MLQNVRLIVLCSEEEQVESYSVVSKYRSTVMNEISRNPLFSLLPYQDYADMPKLYAAVDGIVMNSTIEGLPLAVLEAMAMEKVVLSTRAGDIPRVITHGKNGFLVESPSDIRNILIRLGNQRDVITDLGHAARLKVLSHYSLHSMAAKTQHVYDRVLVSS